MSDAGACGGYADRGGSQGGGEHSLWGERTSGTHLSQDAIPSKSLGIIAFSPRRMWIAVLEGHDGKACASHLTDS